LNANDRRAVETRAVFDCMVFLQGAARRESPVGACLLLVDLGMVELGMIELCISEEILAEIRDVLTRPRSLCRLPAKTGGDDLSK
jgi:predicted nucleic acid-binding protein